MFSALSNLARSAFKGMTLATTAITLATAEATANTVTNVAAQGAALAADGGAIATKAAINLGLGVTSHTVNLSKTTFKPTIDEFIKSMAMESR